MFSHKSTLQQKQQQIQLIIMKKTIHFSQEKGASLFSLDKGNVQCEWVK